MIETENLTKRYGVANAVDRVSFSVGRGEIVGLLGPNGAGKTTTMRMLTTFLRPTSGRARIAGRDVLDEPLEVRRRVGYLPENVPLYPEMRVNEYLSYRAKLKDVPRSRRRSAIDRSIECCRIADVRGRIIGQLSKGYRQRVGLADAMVHDPDLLILDEPTAGLDPMQIREVRALIKDLGESHTILISTHIMQEVEAVCARAIIIVRGRIAVDESLQSMRTENAAVLEAKGPAEAIRKLLETVDGISRVTLTGEEGGYSSFEARIHPGADPREAIAERLIKNGRPLRMLDLRRSSLEERFVRAVREATVTRYRDEDVAGENLADEPEAA